MIKFREIEPIGKLKVKIFTSITTKGFNSIESQIEEWFDSLKKPSEVKFIEQNSFVDSMRADRVVISIFYVEKIE
jgi:hypothetical protein